MDPHPAHPADDRLGGRGDDDGGHDDQNDVGDVGEQQKQDGDRKKSDDSAGIHDDVGAVRGVGHGYIITLCVIPAKAGIQDITNDKIQMTNFQSNPKLKCQNLDFEL